MTVYTTRLDNCLWQMFVVFTCLSLMFGRVQKLGVSLVALHIPSMSGLHPHSRMVCREQVVAVNDGDSGNNSSNDSGNNNTGSKNSSRGGYNGPPGEDAWWLAGANLTMCVYNSSGVYMTNSTGMPMAANSSTNSSGAPGPGGQRST